MRRSRAQRRGARPRIVFPAPIAGAVLAGAAVLLCLLAQASLDKNKGFWFDSALLYGAAVVLWWLALRHESPAPDTVTPRVAGPALDHGRRIALVGGLACVAATAVVAPLLARSGPSALRRPMEWLAIVRYPDGWMNDTNTLTPAGVILWLVGVALFAWAVADPIRLSDLRSRLWRDDALSLRISRPAIALLAIMLLAIGLRFYHLSSVPLEMTSDHTEKLLDVSDVLGGARPVYFPRNAGREPMEFYWIAALVTLGLPLSFMTLKIGMSIVSALTVPVIYWLGKRVHSVEVGLLAALVVALSPWHLQITRAGLRIAFAPLFVALTLGLLVVAFQSGRRNAWLAVGASLGAGMYGYSAFRPMAFMVVAAVVLKLAWDAWQSRHVGTVNPEASAADPGGEGTAAADELPLSGGPPPAAPAGEPDTNARGALRLGPLGGHLAGAAMLSILVAAPLIRFALDQPHTFWGRTLTRVTGAEVPLAHSPIVQLLINWRQALLMFNLTSDSAWFQSPPGRPAMETVTGALFVLGVVTAVFCLFRRRWREPLVLIAIPVMLVSSVLALAFPDEVPHLARASGALPPALVLVALPLTVVVSRWRSAFGQLGTAAALVVFAGLFVWSGRNTVERYFVEYRNTYNQSTLPTMEGAAIGRGFVDMGGDLDHIYLVGWAHGWDYRALGAQMGDLHWNGLLWGAAADGSDAVEMAASHASDPAPQLYFVGGDRAQSDLARLKQLFPESLVGQHHSAATGKDFWTVYVPGKTGEGGGA